MARNKVKDPAGITTWAEADALLEQLTIRQRECERIELDLNDRIATLKNNAKVAIKEHQAVISAGEKQLALFAALHAEDFGKQKSKALTHGIIGWRKSTAVKLMHSVAETVRALLTIGHDDCVKQSAPTVDKQKCKQVLTDEEMVKAGITLDQADTFFWEAAAVTVPELEDEHG